MDASGLAVSWLSFGATVVGLGGLISQASEINNKMDPFHAMRTREYLGIWFQRQDAFPWWRLAKPPPQGPVVEGRGLAGGFCGANTLHVTRIPLLFPGQAGWSLILTMLHPEAPSSLLASRPTTGADAEKAESDSEQGPGSGWGSSSGEEGEGVQQAAAANAHWDHLDRRALTRHQTSACIVISRATLIQMLVFTNARPVFQYSDATGFRGAYPSYCGQWYITWPIGQEAIVKFRAHDSIGATEVLPRAFVHRVDRTAQMATGVIVSAPSPSPSVASNKPSPVSSEAEEERQDNKEEKDEEGLRVAFCGRKPAGTYRLEHSARGFQGAHGSRHLYNMLGGRAYEIDYLFARALTSPLDLSSDSDRDASSEQQQQEVLILTLPSKDNAGPVSMHIPPATEHILQHALDVLPWTSLSWSIHRGLRDILVAYARPTMDAHRASLAALLRSAVAAPATASALRARGWDPAFVRHNMADMAASAVLAGAGNSGDSVRVVTDIVAVMIGGKGDGGNREELARLDNVRFWRGRPRSAKMEVKLDKDAIVALTKVFVLEWSQEFDYQIYHHLPISLYFG
ncbi:hypothetical protein GGR56DRAFT_674668 [Xylariaceae sp. FL0804]|nr:hypothetical protein GGR56DRAFT_674668 [Xylariaceae sp. FL0804]